MNAEAMTKWFFEQAREKGFTILLLFLAVYYLDSQNRETKVAVAVNQERLDQCQDQIVSMYQDDHHAMIKVLSQTSGVMERLERRLK